MRLNMGNKLLTLILIFLASRAFAQVQTNDEGTLDKCAQIFQGNNEKVPFDPDELIRNNKELRDCMIGKKFPSFRAMSMDGKEYSNLDLQGKVVLLSSWFIGCAPCEAEIPLFNELNQEFKGKGFLLLSFSRDNIGYLANFLKEKPITYAILPNSEELLRKLKTTYGYPTNIFLNKNGEIAEFSTGGRVDEDGLRLTKATFRAIIMSELAK